MKPHALLIVGMTALVSNAASPEPITVLDENALAWESTAEGVAFAALQGNRFEEAYQAMVKLPSGTVSPLHRKSAAMYGVMVQGEMIHYASGVDPATATRVAPGGFYHIPAGLAHISACVSDNECVTYLYQDGAFDFQIIQ